MKTRYKIVIVGLLVTFYYSVIAGVIGVVFFFAWCLIRASREFNDDCMLHETYSNEVEKSSVMVSEDGIAWGDVRP